ncbi:hypothetical protein OAC04_05850, partial [Gammaproteobacteria bacterium]|nr:hypothetical protein [Gammaproteobacteria bacterium]
SQYWKQAENPELVAINALSQTNLVNRPSLQSELLRFVRCFIQTFSITKKQGSRVSCSARDHYQQIATQKKNSTDGRQKPEHDTVKSKPVTPSHPET